MRPQNAARPEAFARSGPRPADDNLHPPHSDMTSVVPDPFRGNDWPPSPLWWRGYLAGYERAAAYFYELGRQDVIDEHKRAGAALARLMPPARRQFDARARRERLAAAPVEPVDLEERHRRCAESWGMSPADRHRADWHGRAAG